MIRRPQIVDEPQIERHSEPVRTLAWESVLRQNLRYHAAFGEYGLPHQ